MKYFFLFILLFCHTLAFGQKDTLYKPKSILDLFEKFDAYLESEKKEQIKFLPEDSLRNTERWSNGLLHGFNYNLDCQMAKDLQEKGIGANTDDYYYLLLVCYHRYLNRQDIGLEEELKFYDALREERRKWYQEALKRDSVGGKYIPSNLVDCFIELDKILSNKDIKYIKKNGTEGLHMTLGMFIRNRWQLWGGSRLKKYFLDINSGPMHPDSMSGVILKYYGEWLKGNKDAWREWEAKMIQKNNSR